MTPEQVTAGYVAAFYGGVLFVGFGVVFLIGARRRWTWLVDPPAYLWFCYTQSLFKVLLGRNGLLRFTYVLAVLFIAAGAFFATVGALGFLQLVNAA